MINETQPIHPGDISPVRKPHLTIRPTRGWQALDLRELFQFRDLLTTLAGRDIKLRYRQTALGALWVILQPLLAAGIFSFVFGKLAKLPSDGVPYFLFAFCGQLGWNAFNSTLMKANASLVQNANLVSKIYFPRLILPLSTVFSTLVDFLVALAMLPVLMVIAHVAPGWGVLLLPVWFILLVLIAVGVGLYTSALMVSYRDVQYVIPVLLQFLMYASPVTYSAALVPAHWRLVYSLNPLAGLLEAFRWSLLGRGHVDWAYVVYGSVLSILVFVGGTYSFKKMERRFADVI